MMTASFQLRKGSAADTYPVFLLFEETLYDLQSRLGQEPPVRWDEPEKLQAIWQLRENLYNHLAVHADQFWVAESEGKIAGFARSILHDGARELTEFFVRPGTQAAGIGKALLEKAIPEEKGIKLSILASLDLPAQVRYFNVGTHHRFMVMYFGKQPSALSAPTGYRAEALPPGPDQEAFVSNLDRQALGFTRPDTHEYLLRDRNRYRFLRPDGQIAGYGYVGKASGPFLLNNPADYPAVLKLAENEAASAGYKHFGLEVPMVNTCAVNALIEQGYQIDPFMAIYMSSEPLPAPERYILTSPPFVI